MNFRFLDIFLNIKRASLIKDIKNLKLTIITIANIAIEIDYSKEAGGSLAYLDGDFQALKRSIFDSR